MEIKRNGSQPSTKGPADYFTGSVRIGDSLGLGIVVAVLAAAGSNTLDARHLPAHRVAASLTTGTAMLLPLAVVLALIVRLRKVRKLLVHPPGTAGAHRLNDVIHPVAEASGAVEMNGG